MSKPKKISPVECGPFLFGVNLDAVAKALLPKHSGVNPPLVDLLYSIEWFKDRVKQAEAVIKQKHAIPNHLRKVSQKIVFNVDHLSHRLELLQRVDEFHPIVPAGDNDVIEQIIAQIIAVEELVDGPMSDIETDELDDATWPEPLHFMSSGARVIAVDELDDAIEARDIERQTLNLKLSEFNDLCERALTCGESEVFLQIAEILKALKERPVSFLVFQAWMLGRGESSASEIRKQVNEWLEQDGRKPEIINTGSEKTITITLKMIGLPYPDGKNKKSRN